MKPFTQRAAASAFALLLSLGLVAGVRASAGEDDPAYAGAMKDGRTRLEKQDCSGAVRAFRQAEKLSAEPSAELLTLLCRAYTCFGSWQDAEVYGRRAVAAAADPAGQAEAYYRLGQALSRGGEASPEQAEAAIEAYRQALAASGGRLAVVQFDLGEALLELGRDEEGVALLEAFVADWPNTQMAKRARGLIANPKRARVPMIPEFSLTTLAGKRLATADLEGKVVLFEFWATGCEPCRKVIPALKDLARRSAKEPLMVIGVSNDRDDEALRRFVAEHELGWTHLRDEDRNLAGELGVTKLPTFVLADPAGVILFRSPGGDLGLETALLRQLNQALKAAKKGA